MFREANMKSRKLFSFVKQESIHVSIYPYSLYVIRHIRLEVSRVAVLSLNHLFYRKDCLRSGLSWFYWWVSFAPDFQCWYFCESSCLYYLRFNFDFYVCKMMHL